MTIIEENILDWAGIRVLSDIILYNLIANGLPNIRWFYFKEKYCIGVV